MKRLVVLEARATPSFVDALRRTWDDGDAVLPLDPRLPGPARAEVLASARPDQPVVEGDALVVATSGTTGAPKAVVLTHAAVAASATATSRRLGVDAGRDRWLACLPLAHVGGLGVVTRALHTSTSLTVTERTDAASLAAAAEAGCTLVALVAAMLDRVDAAAFRALLLGGSAMPPQLPPNAVASYGMTETGSGVVYDGRPLDGVDLRIVDDEIQVRGPMLLRAYRDGTDPKDGEGWLPTGDAGEVDAATGRLRVHGRVGDVIVTGGEKVWPTPVELALGRHPQVDEVLVVGRADPTWGERVVAVIVPADTSDTPSLDVLRDWVKQTLPPWAAPHELEVRGTLPRTALGKVIRQRGRARTRR
ncbi:MAG: class I adenylate-forming enzyme family protein [Acidimicrobiales bacterium]